MFVPAIVAGSLLSITFWIITMLILRSYGWMRKRLFPSQSKQDLEMCSSSDNKVSVQLKANINISDDLPELQNISREQTMKSLSLQCESKPTKLLKSISDEKLSSVSRSYHPSPISVSSGIGVSERDSSGGEEESCRHTSGELDQAADHHHHHDQGHESPDWGDDAISAMIIFRMAKFKYAESP